MMQDLDLSSYAAFALQLTHTQSYHQAYANSLYMCVSVRVSAGDGAQGELHQKVASPCQAGSLEPPQQRSDPHANHR